MTKQTSYKNFEICSHTFLDKDFLNENAWYVEGNIIIHSATMQAIPLPNNGSIYKTESDADKALEARAIKYINGTYIRNLRLKDFKKKRSIVFT